MLRTLINNALLNLRNEKGQGMVEYALLVGLIAIVVIAALLLLGPAIKNIFTNITTELTPSTVFIQTFNL